MFRKAFLLCLWSLYVVDSLSMTMACLENDHCASGYYCDTSANICKQCVNCHDFNRQPPLAVNICIESVAECGVCYKGYQFVVNRHGDVNDACVVETEDTPKGMEPGDTKFVLVTLSFIKPITK